MNTLTRRETFALEFAKVLVATGMAHRPSVDQGVKLADDLIRKLDNRERLPETRPG